VLKEVPSIDERGSRLKTIGRVSGLFTVGLLAALAAPREAKAIGYFTSATATVLPAVQPCQDSQPGCYTHWLVAADLEGDGDMDILLSNGGSYYTTGKADESVVYLNDGKGVLTNVTPTLFNNAHNRNRQIAVADVDGDGDLDIYQPGAYGLDLDKLWIQTATGVYEDRAATLLPEGLMSHAGSCHMGDLDGDGDMDLINMDWGVGSTATIAHAILYTNDGKGKFTLAAIQNDLDFYQATDRLPVTIPGSGAPPSVNPTTAGTVTYWGTRAIDVDFADVDADFDLDILVNMRNGFSRIFLNDGFGNFKDGTNFAIVTSADGLKQTATTNYPIKQGPYVYNQDVCDVDDDGDLDLLIDNAGQKPTVNNSWSFGGGNGGNVSQILINNGRGKFTDDTVNRITGEPGSDDNAVKCADLNNDNHYDLIVASLQGRSEKLLLNDGVGHFNFVADGVPYGFSGPYPGQGSPTEGDFTLGIELTDLNGDKMLDMVTGQGEGRNYDEKAYFGGGGSMPDTKPPIFRAVETPAPLSETPTIVRYALRDNVTNDAGQHIKVSSVTYSVGGGTPKTVPGKFFGGDLFRATIPAQSAGTVVKYKISATDRAGNVGTSAEITYTVPTPVDPPIPVGVGGSGGGGGSAPTAGTGGASAGTGGTSAGSAGEAGSVETGEGGEAGEVSVGGSTSTGGASTGTGGKAGGKAGSSGAGTGEAGESSTGSGGRGSYVTVDDGGCSVSSSTPASKGRGAALLGLGLAMLGLVRRRRNSK